MKLRPYQTEALNALEAEWQRGNANRLVVLLPTGMGKTVIFSNLITRHLKGNVGGKALVLVHRDELVTQAKEKIEHWNPGLNVGIVKASRNEVDNHVIVASVQTLGRSEARRQALGEVGLVIVDECHHAVANTYMATIKGLGGFKGTRIAGFTATLERSDDLGLGDVWQKVVYTREIKYAIDNGYLVKPKTKTVVLSELRLEGVRKTRSGDLSATELGKAMQDAHAPEAVAQAYRDHCPYKQGVVFAPTVALATEIAKAFTARRIPAAVISGDTKAEDRELIYHRTRRGQIQVLVNVMVLTEGFDMPQLEVAVIARPTASRALYTQMVGRVLRLNRGKTEALIIDVVGASVGKTDLKTCSSLAKTHRDAERRGGGQGGSAPPADAEVSYRIDISTGYMGRCAIVTRTEKRGGRTRHEVIARINHIRGTNLLQRAEAARRRHILAEFGFAHSNAPDLTRRVGSPRSERMRGTKQ